MTDLYEVLEICLKEIEQGADVDTVLFRHPEFADELRPILETSAAARAMAAPAPSEEAVRRNRAKVLGHASELRERKAAPASRRLWSVPLRRALVTFMVVAVLFASGTGLVRASSATLPGDNLYPVKRGWESLSLFFTLNTEKREALEFEHENERLEELSELLASGRSAKVDFAGYVTRQSGTEWRVSGITVFLSADTRLPDQPVAVGDAVRVRGQTQNGGVAAERIELLPSGYRLPDVNDEELEIEEEKPEDSDEETEVEPAKPSRTETPVPSLTATATPEKLKIEGSVTSVQNILIVVNGIVMDLRFAEEVKGTPAVGAFAKAEGYYDGSGIFIVTKIEFTVSSSGGAAVTAPADDDDTNVNTNDNDNVDDDTNTNDNGDDSSGGGSDDNNNNDD
jgi:hypothetical protein